MNIKVSSRNDGPNLIDERIKFIKLDCKLFLLDLGLKRGV